MKQAVKTEPGISGIPQPSATTVTLQASAAAGTSQAPAKPTGNAQAPNGTTSLPASKLPAVSSCPLNISIPANVSFSHRHIRPVMPSRPFRGVEVTYVAEEEGRISHPEESPVPEVEEALHSVVDPI
jgi:hypothetical protein